MRRLVVFTLVGAGLQPVKQHAVTPEVWVKHPLFNLLSEKNTSKHSRRSQCAKDPSFQRPQSMMLWVGTQEKVHALELVRSILMLLAQNASAPVTESRSKSKT